MGIAWVIVSVVCICIAERFMAHNEFGDYGRLVYYRTWGPSAIVGACVAAVSFAMGNRADRAPTHKASNGDV